MRCGSSSRSPAGQLLCLNQMIVSLEANHQLLPPAASACRSKARVPCSAGCMRILAVRGSLPAGQLQWPAHHKAAPCATRGRTGSSAVMSKLQNMLSRH